MGMGFSASYADVIDAQAVASLAPQSWAALTSLWGGDKLEQQDGIAVLCFLVNPDLYGYEVAKSLILASAVDSAQQDDTAVEETPLLSEDAYEARIDEYEKVWEALCAEFRANTLQQGGSELELGMGYHSEDDGDRYDDVVGAFFTVDGVWGRTPAGQAFEELIERKFYVTLG